MIISNAKDRTLDQNPGTLPDMTSTLTSWFQQLTFTQIVKTIVNFAVVEATTSTAFMGVKQPFTAQQLAIKPEGQRAWRWHTIHSFPDLILNTDEQITFTDGVTYRVKEKLDYKEYGYVEYHVVEDYTP